MSPKSWPASANWAHPRSRLPGLPRHECQGISRHLRLQVLTWLTNSSCHSRWRAAAPSPRSSRPITPAVRQIPLKSSLIVFAGSSNSPAVRTWFQFVERHPVAVEGWANKTDSRSVPASQNWCGRPDLNRHRPCGPTDFHTTSAFAATQNGRSWSGLSLHLGVAALGAARLVSTPSRCRAWLGIASEGFPEFEQFYIGSFPPSTQSLKSGASTIPPRPRTPELYPNPIGLLSPVRLPVLPRGHSGRSDTWMRGDVQSASLRHRIATAGVSGCSCSVAAPGRIRASTR